MKRSLVALIFALGAGLAFHNANAAAPTCNGQTATVYVDSGVIVGGPNNGSSYTGTLTASSASIIVGTSGNDTITGSGSNDTICPGDGNDTIDGGTGTDTIAFTTNSDTSGITISVTGSGSGSITTSTGSSTFTRAESFVGTAYNDTFTMGTSGALTSVNGGAGSDTIDYSSRSSALSLNMYTGVLTSISGSVSNIENLTGGSGADTIIGNSSANTLTGNGGNDIIFGGDGADTLLGGTGRNIIIGGKGVDTITTDSSSTGDIDIADEVTFANSTTANTTSLGSIRSEWTSGATSYANRVAHIQGTLAGGLNASIYLQIATLQYDNSADSISANTASIQSWYIVKNSLDTITTAFSGETTTDTSIPLTISSSANPTAAGNDVTFTASSTQTAATGTITIYKDSTSLGTCTLSSGSCTYLASGLTGGSYSMTAVYGGDSSYSASTSNAITQVMTDTTAPTVTEVTAVTTPTNDSTPNYTFNTNEAGTITYSGSCSSATTSASSGNNTITFNTLSDGTYSTCTVSVTDASSNASTPLTVTTFQVDTTAPTTSDNYGSKDGNWQNANQSITLTPADATSGIASTKYCTDSTNTCSPSSGTSYTTAVSFSTEGTTYFRYASTDTAGNTQTTVSRSVKIDKTNPTVSAGSDQTKHTSFTQTATASDSTAGINASTYQWAKVSGPGTVTFGSATSLSSTVSTNADGTYVISFTASDNAGNSSTSNFNLTWDATVPTAAITYSINHAVKSGDSLVITATFNEAVLDSPIPKIAISGNNTVAATNMTKTSTTVYTYTYTVGSGDGTDTVSLSNGTDAAGNTITSTPTSGATFTVDNTGPNLTETTAVSTPTADTTPDYTFSSNEAGTITYGGSCSSATTSASSGNNTITFNTLSDGTYSTCTVSVTDAAGNISNPLTLTSFTISTSTASPSEPTVNNGGGGGSSAEVPVALAHSAPTQNLTSKTIHGFSTKVSDPDQVKKVTMRILGATYTLKHAIGSATYNFVLNTLIKVTKAAYVLTIDYGSYNIKQYGILSLFAKPSTPPTATLITNINATFRKAYGRNPSYQEWAYWVTRVKQGDKKTITELLGAMQWHALHKK